MHRLYFIFVPILIGISQCINAQGRAVEVTDESDGVNKLCKERENYCCNYAAIKIHNDEEENHELIVKSSIPSYSNAFFGSILIIISLLILRTLSKRVEE